MAIDMKRPIPIDIEPKRKNRFVVEFPEDMGFAQWMCQAANRPNMRIEETELPYMNISTWIAGRAVWETIDIRFIDPIGPSAGAAVYSWVQQCVDHGTGQMGYATQYKKNIVLKLLDPSGIPVEKWVLYGAFITSANWGDLDMSSSDLADVSVTIRFDRAVLEAV